MVQPPEEPRTLDRHLRLPRLCRRGVAVVLAWIAIGCGKSDVAGPPGAAAAVDAAGGLADTDAGQVQPDAHADQPEAAVEQVDVARASEAALGEDAVDVPVAVADGAADTSLDALDTVASSNDGDSSDATDAPFAPTDVSQQPDQQTAPGPDGLVDAPPVDVAAEVTAAMDAAMASDATLACAPKPELCDGVDNDCDGATDEGYAWKPPPPWPAVPLGEPCGAFECAGGTVVCQTPELAVCSTCPSTIDPTVMLAPPGAAKSALQASGSFTDVSPLLPATSLQIDAGSPLQVPYGASGLAIDADGDGDLDLWWSDGVSKGVLWLQVTPWEFQAKNLVTLIAKPASVAALPGPLGPTLVVAGGGLAALERQPSGNWNNVAATLGLNYTQNDPPLQHLLPADVNDDGTLDLVGSVFSCTAGKKALVVWLSRGAGGFVEANSAMGLLANASPWATMQSDFDDDGLQDLLVLTETCNPNPGVIFYRHQPLGSADPTYVMKKVPPLFTAPGKPAGSPMGGALADLNGDGVLDYLMAEIELGDLVKMGGDPKKLKADDPWLYNGVSNHLLLSQSDGSRKQAGWQAGVWAPLSKAGNLMVAWSPALVDLDHDGHVDILLSHGSDYGAWAKADAGKMRPVAWRNDGTQQFVDMSTTWGLPDEHDTRAMVLADLDGDGDDDLVLGGQAVAPRILRNDLSHQGADLRVVLQGATSNPWGLGARLKLLTDLRTVVHEHSVQAPSQTMQTPVAHFALKPGEQAQSLQVQWPSGWLQTVATPAKGKLTVAEPKLVELSSRWSPKGETPVKVTAWHWDAAGKAVSPASCSIELADGAQGKWLGAMTCADNACTRIWEGPGVQPNGADVVVASCGGKALTIRPRIFY